MSQQQSTSFFDGRTIAAILLVGMSWLGWQYYMTKKYPSMNKKDAQVETAAATAEKAGTTSAATAKGNETTKSSDEFQKNAIEPVKLNEEIMAYEDENVSVLISSFGMGFKSIKLKKYTDRAGNLMEMGGTTAAPVFSTNVVGRRDPLPFKITKVEDRVFVGEAVLDGYTVSKRMVIDPQTYTIATKVDVKGNLKNFSGLSTFVTDKVHEVKSGSFLLPSFDKQEIYVSHDATHDRKPLTPDAAEVSAYSKVDLFSMGSQYFALAVQDKSNVMPELKTYVDKNVHAVVSVLNHSLINQTDAFSVEYTAFAGPKSWQLLKSIGDNFTGIVDFGMFSFIAKYILLTLKGFYKVIGNWGVAIILLTILVRLLVLPFNIMSYRSMKSMQVIQPILKDIRERLKSDPQKMNQEVMRVMREHKVNPLGGCLPILLQFPIFIALYQVLGQSIELYQAPFALWIHDLSLKDPFFVLPVLMGVTMFVQQKMTPSTMDPAQAKIMMFMPVLFSFLMITLPSGLTLYIFISSLFAVVQQYFFMRGNPKPQTV